MEEVRVLCVTMLQKGYGGLLAKDLTNAHKRLGGITAIKGLLPPPYPSMQETYINHPITEEEAVYLSLYLQDVNKITTWFCCSILDSAYCCECWSDFIAIFILSIWHKRKRKRKC
jgi:hypothetical protein